MPLTTKTASMAWRLRIVADVALAAVIFSPDPGMFVVHLTQLLVSDYIGYYNGMTMIDPQQIGHLATSILIVAIDMRWMGSYMNILYCWTTTST